MKQKLLVAAYVIAFLVNSMEFTENVLKQLVNI